jgi:hypothetical protein
MQLDGSILICLLDLVDLFQNLPKKSLYSIIERHYDTHVLTIYFIVYVGFGGTFALTMAGYFELEDNNLTLFFRKLCFALFFPVSITILLRSES